MNLSAAAAGPGLRLLIVLVALAALVVATAPAPPAFAQDADPPAGDADADSGTDADSGDDEAGDDSAEPQRGSDPPIRPRPKHIDAAAEACIKRGLAGLVRMQGADGAWNSEGRAGSYSCTMTGMAGLALLAGGHTPTRGEYAPHLRKAIRYLLRQANEEDGLIAANAGRSMYGHGFATLFLAEVWGMTGDLKVDPTDANSPTIAEKLGVVLDKACKLIARSQSREGGWYYTPGSATDEGSVTVTQLQAMRACKNAGVDVPRAVIGRAIDYLGKCQQPDGGISYRFGMNGSRPPLAAAAVATIFYAGDYDHPVAQKALKFCVNHNMWAGYGSGAHYWYTHFYLAQAYYQAGPKYWDRYFRGMKKMIIETQRPDGSWVSRGTGRLFSTAVSLIILQLPYQNLPIYQR